VLLLVTMLGLALDLASKSWAFHRVAEEPVELRYEEVAGNPSYRLPWHAGVRALPGDLLDFRLVLNHGAVFGLGQQRRVVFVAFTVLAVVAAVADFGLWTGARARWVHVGIGLVLAGGLGNLYDRLTLGYVVDFLFFHYRGWSWPAFNVADSAISVGVVLLLWDGLRKPQQ